MEDDQDDPPQNKLKYYGNLLVNPDPVTKMMSQVNMTSTQSKNEGNDINTPSANFSRTGLGRPKRQGITRGSQKCMAC